MLHQNVPLYAVFFTAIGSAVAAAPTSTESKAPTTLAVAPAASRPTVDKNFKRGFGCMVLELIAWIVPGSPTAPDCLPQTVADLWGK